MTMNPIQGTSARRARSCFFSFHFNSSTLRSALIKEDTESLSVWSSHSDVVLCCLVLTWRACIIEGKRWIRMMSWLDCGARLGGNAVRETRGGIKILRGGWWRQWRGSWRQRRDGGVNFYLKRNCVRGFSVQENEGRMNGSARACDRRCHLPDWSNTSASESESVWRLRG